MLKKRDCGLFCPAEYLQLKDPSQESVRAASSHHCSLRKRSVLWINLNAVELVQHENPAGGPELESEGKITASLRSVPPGTSSAALSPHQSSSIKWEGEMGLIWISWTSTTWEAARLGFGLALFNCSPLEALARRLQQARQSD